VPCKVERHGVARRRALVWGAILLVAFLAPAGPKLLEGDELVPLDTAAYMRAAREVQRRGGPVAMLVGCITGTYREANRMPLYIGLLSLLPGGTLRSLLYAKVLTLGIASIGLLVAYACAWRTWGPIAAVAAGAAIAVNSHYLLYGTVVASETLLSLWLTVTWVLLVRYQRGRGDFAPVGASVALAYLSKGSGIFVAPLSLVVAGVKERWRAFASRGVWVAVGIFVLATCPLLARNVRLYGAPFYNENTHVMWQDAWEEKYSPDPELNRPTLATYCARHTAGDALARLGRGIWQQGVYSVVVMGQTTLFHEILGWKVWPLGLLALGLGLVPLVRRPDRSAALIGWGMFAGFNLFFAWYPVKDARFVAPLVPVMMILSGRGAHLAFRAASRAWLPLRGVRPWRGVAAVTALMLVANSALAPRLAPVREALTPPPGYFDLLCWLSGHTTRKTVVMMGPSHEYDYFWTDAVGGHQVPVPWVHSMDDLQRAIREQEVDYLVVDYSTLRQRAGAFQGWMTAVGEAVRVKEVPAGWRPVFFAGDGPGAIVFDVARCAHQ